MRDETATIEVTVDETVTIQSDTGTRGYWIKSRYVSRGSTGHWSKWGGGRADLSQAEVSEVWYCQSCNTPQPKTLSPYRMEFIKGEYLRICANCLKDGCQDLRRRVGKLPIEEE